MGELNLVSPFNLIPWPPIQTCHLFRQEIYLFGEGDFLKRGRHPS